MCFYKEYVEDKEDEEKAALQAEIAQLRRENYDLKKERLKQCKSANRWYYVSVLYMRAIKRWLKKNCLPTRCTKESYKLLKLHITAKEMEVQKQK